jgi:hypothetical protein
VKPGLADCRRCERSPRPLTRLGSVRCVALELGQGRRLKLADSDKAFNGHPLKIECVENARSGYVLIAEVAKQLTMSNTLKRMSIMVLVGDGHEKPIYRSAGIIFVDGRIGNRKHPNFRLLSGARERWARFWCLLWVSARNLAKYSRWVLAEWRVAGNKWRVKPRPNGKFNGTDPLVDTFGHDGHHLRGNEYDKPTLFEQRYVLERT